LQLVWVYFTPSLAAPSSNSCLIYYNVASNQINLMNDAGTSWLTGTPGTYVTLENSQCAVGLQSIFTNKAGNSLTFDLPMTFKSTFAGTKNIYMYANDASGATVGWQQAGTWTVLASQGVPILVSASPSSGAGTSQTFQLEYSDTISVADLQLVWVGFTSTIFSTSSSCLLYYNVSSKQLNLMNDAGTSWFVATLGTATTLQNSQCSVNVSTATATINGNNLTLSLPMTFQESYAGDQDVLLSATDVSGPTVGWATFGTWTVP